MGYSVKDELEQLIKVGTAGAGHNGLLRTLIRAKATIESLERRLAGTLTARDKIALHMLPGTAGIADPGEAMGAAFKAADLFIEASKEVPDHG